MTLESNPSVFVGLENLPSEIQYHWAEIRNRYDQAKGSWQDPSFFFSLLLAAANLIP